MKGFFGGSGGGGGSTGEEWFNDGDTHIWITLQEGRTSPMLGVCPKGTVTVDWGDGTETDVLTGTSTFTVKWTPTHNYAKPGDYIITLKVDGEMGLSGNDSTDAKCYLLRFSSAVDGRNAVYQNTITSIELGNGVTNIGTNAFSFCYSLKSVVIPDSVTSFGEYAFNCCYSLKSVVIPDSVTSFGRYAFSNCYSLKSVVIPDSFTSIGNSEFNNCCSLTSVVIPDSVMSIGGYAFYQCRTLTSVVIPDSVMSIGSHAFGYCYGVAYYDFTHHTQVPTLSSTNAFLVIPADCEIRVPAALYDEWIAATNWSTFASNIVAV
jgi:hypothetical protein